MLASKVWVKYEKIMELYSSPASLLKGLGSISSQFKQKRVKYQKHAMSFQLTRKELN